MGKQCFENSTFKNTVKYFNKSTVINTGKYFINKLMVGKNNNGKNIKKKTSLISLIVRKTF